MIASRYLDRVTEILGEIRALELPRLEELAGQIADALSSGGLFYVYDNGHMLNTELFNRAGGLALLAPIELGRPRLGTAAVRPGGEPAAVPASVDDDLTLARMAVRRAGVKAGDVVLLGSVSGRSPLVVELAEESARRGALTVGLTALRYSTTLPASHPSGRRLYEAVAVVLDTHTGIGDAEVAVDGLAERVLPSSGISAALVAWCLIAALIEALLERGVEPTVFRSINYPDGPERHAAALERYRRLGY